MHYNWYDCRYNIALMNVINYRDKENILIRIIVDFFNIRTLQCWCYDVIFNIYITLVLIIEADINNFQYWQTIFAAQYFCYFQKNKETIIAILCGSFLSKILTIIK